MTNNTQYNFTIKSTKGRGTRAVPTITTTKAITRYSKSRNSMTESTKAKKSSKAKIVTTSHRARLCL
jgi:hypothetical protein